MLLSCLSHESHRLPFPVRRLITITLCLLAGALLTIALAIVPPLFTILDPVSAQPPSHGTPWPIRIRGTTTMPSNVLFSANAFAEQREYFGWYVAEIPDETTRIRVISYRAGWPMRALAWQSADQRNFLKTITGLRGRGPRKDLTHSRLSRGIPLPDFITTRIRTLNDTIPIQPILPGFLINTALYTLILYLLFTTPGRIRRRSRLRRHACLKCGYHIQNLTRCPECGDIPAPPPTP